VRGLRNGRTGGGAFRRLNAECLTAGHPCMLQYNIMAGRAGIFRQLRYKVRLGVVVVALAMLLQLLAVSLHHHSLVPARGSDAAAAAGAQAAASEQVISSEDRSSPNEEGRAVCQVCWLAQLAGSIDLPADAAFAAAVIYGSRLPIAPEPPVHVAGVISILKARGPPHA
jgi:hypothetical protein